MIALQTMRTRIVAGAVATAVAVAVVLVAVLDQVRSGERDAGLLAGADALAGAVALAVEIPLTAADRAAVAAVLRATTASGRVTGAVVLDTRRAVVAAEPAELAAVALLAGWPAAASSTKLQVQGREMLAVFRQVGALAPVGGVWVVVDREPVAAATRRFRLLALLVTVAIVGMTLGLASLAAERFVRPLDALGETVAALGRGELQTRHEVAGPEELRRLARRVNRMAEQLEASQASLGRLAADLEHQVRERTREFEAANRRLGDLANTDPLTGLANRRGLEIELDRYLALSRRNRQPLAVIMMDLDNFKTYNDRCGHLSGDTVLRAVAVALRGQGRGSDVVARWGGDEFCILVPATDPAGAQGATQRFVIAALEAMGDLSRSDVSAVLGASAGYACYPADGEEARELIARADAALYKVKASGGSGVLRASLAVPDEPSGDE